MPDKKTYTVEELAKNIKDKYPQYSELDDRELVDKVTAKYPEYKDVLKKKDSGGQSQYNSETQSLSKEDKFTGFDIHGITSSSANFSEDINLFPPKTPVVNNIAGDWQQAYSDKLSRMQLRVDKKMNQNLQFDDYDKRIISSSIIPALSKMDMIYPIKENDKTNEGYVGGTQKEIGKGFAESFRGIQSFLNTLDDATGGIFGFLASSDPARQATQLAYLTSKGDDKKKLGDIVDKYKKESREKAPFETVAKWWDYSVSGFKDMPDTVFGDMLSGMAHVVPLIAELAITPEVKLNIAGVNVMSKLALLEGTKGAYRGYMESEKETEIGKNIEALRGLGMGYAQGSFFHSLGVGASEGGRIVQGLTKSKLADQATSSILMGIGFGGQDALQQWAETGEIDMRKVYASFGTGVGLSLPGVIDVARGRAINNLMNTSDNAIKIANLIDIKPKDLMKSSIEIGKRAFETKDLNKRGELLAAKQTIDNVLNLQAATKEVAENTDVYKEVIKNSADLSKEQKTDLINKIDRITGDNKSIIENKPSEKTSPKVEQLPAEEEIVASTPLKSPKNIKKEVKTTKTTEELEKEGMYNEMVDKYGKKRADELMSEFVKEEEKYSAIEPIKSKEEKEKIYDKSAKEIDEKLKTEKLKENDTKNKEWVRSKKPKGEKFIEEESIEKTSQEKTEADRILQTPKKEIKEGKIEFKSPEKTLASINSVIDSIVLKSTVEQSKKDIAKQKITEGTEELLKSIGAIKSIIGEERVDPVKSIQKIAEGIMELGVENAKELVQRVKDWLINDVGVKEDKANEFIKKADLDNIYNSGVQGKLFTEKPKTEQEIKQEIAKEKINYKEEKKKIKGDIREGIIERRGELNLSTLETNLFTEQLNKDLSKKEREAIPFLIEKTKVPDKLGRQDLKEIVEEKDYKTKSGQPISGYAKKIQKHFDDSWKKIVQNTDKLDREQIEDYVTHIWDIPKNKVSDVTTWFATKNRFLNKRYIDTYASGIELYGLKPRTLDVGDIIRIHDSMSNAVIANNKFLKYLKELESRGFPLITTKAKAPIDYKESRHPALSYKRLIPSEKGDVVVTEHYMIHPDAEKPLSVIFGHKMYDKAGILKGYEQIGGLMKKTQLSLSLFHHLALTETAVAAMGPLKTAKALGQIGYYAYRGITPVFAKQEIARDAAQHTLNFGGTLDIPIKEIQKTTDKIHEWAKNNKIPVGRELAWFAKTFNKKWDDGLWTYLHDGLKLLAYEDAISKIPDKYKTTEDIRKYKIETAQFINDTFGGQNWDILMKSPAVQQILRWSLLSPDWTLSTIRQGLAPMGYGRIYKDFGSRFNNVRVKKGFAFWGKAAIYYGVGMNLLNVYYRKKDEERHPELYERPLTFMERTMYGNTMGHKTHLYTGRFGDGSERYLRWGKQFREVPELIESPLRKIGGKAAPQLQLISQLMTGSSLSGYENWDLKDKKGLDWIQGAFKTTGKSFLPFMSSNIFRDDKEWSPTDLFMPSSKGMSASAAIKFYKKGMLFDENSGLVSVDIDYITEIYSTAVRNNLDAYKLFKTAITDVKAERTREIKNLSTTIDETTDQLSNAKNVADTERLERRLNTLIERQNNLRMSWENLHALEGDMVANESIIEIMKEEPEKTSK